MKTILQINTVVNSGSTGRIAEEIGQLAIESGWKSYIAFGRNKRSSVSSLIPVGTKIDFFFHVLLCRFFDLHGFGSRWATYRLVNKINKIKPDIIHLHNLHGYYLNIEILFNYLKRKSIPIVWTLHDCWAFTGHCAYFDFVGCNRWKDGCYSCPQKKSYPSSIFLDRSKSNYKNKKELFNGLSNLNLVPVSNWLNSIQKQSFLNNYESLVIHNGVDLDIFKPSHDNDILSKLSVENKTIILGVANIWDRRKGLFDFIQLRSILDERFLIVLIGLTKKQISTLPKGILGLERTENLQQLVNYYSLASVFVNPTWEDNFPTTNLESLACGTPVITYKTGGSVEAIDENTGFIVEKGDIEDIKRKILLICNQNLKEYRFACRERAIRLFNKSERYRDYLKLYDKLIS